MKRSIATVIGGFPLFMLCLCIGVPVAGADQIITGTVVDAGGAGIRGIQVTILDSKNAVEAATTATDYNGTFNSPNIPSGSYRVRFAGSDQFGRLLSPEFYGDTERDEFCGGAVVSVLPDTRTGLKTEDMQLAEPLPAPEGPVQGAIHGTVVDAETGVPLQGVQVAVFLSDNAQTVPISSGTSITDADGRYRIAFQVVGTDLIRIRFSDPTGIFFSEYSGESDLTRDHDVFCAGTVLRVDPAGTTQTVNGFLDRIPAEQLTENLTGMVTDLDIPANVEAVLATPLIRAVDLLTDDTPNNDAGVCAQLASFITRVDIQEKTGQLSPEEADALRQSATNIRTTLGCS
ncbi:MAG: carboxypeptidase-like regulatory domain-containing protein [Nitrospirota bacterium]